MLKRFERFSLATSKISRCWNKIAAEEMEKYNLKGSCALYLLTICRSNGAITVTKLAETCSRDKADVSRSVSRMEKSGLVIKERSGANLYRAKLALTEKGKAAAESIGKSACLAVNTAGNGVADADREIFYSVLERIAENLEEICNNGLSE